MIVSGGFATVQPGSQLSINAVEGYPLEDFSADAVRNQIAEAQKIAGGSGSEHDIAEAKIELEVSFESFLLRDENVEGVVLLTVGKTGAREPAGCPEIETECYL